MTIKGGLQRARACLLGSALLAGCTFINTPNGGGEPCVAGTQVGDPNEVAAGCVHDEDGNPAVAATVLVYLSNRGALAKSGADSAGNPAVPSQPDTLLVKTNENGRFSISNKLRPENYDILIQSDTSVLLPDGSPKPHFACLKTNVHLDSAAGHYSLPLQKLLPRGVVQGRVVDKYFSTISGATCQDPGGRFVAKTDETGWFNLSLPQGTYTLICSHSPQKPVKLESIKVLSNQENRIPTVQLNDGDGNITPVILTAKYDTLTGIVHLSWPKTPFSGFFRYEVRRIDVNKFPDSMVYHTTDTAYDDLVYKHRSDKDSTRLYYSVIVRTNTGFTDWANSSFLDVKPPKVVGPDIEMGYKTVSAGPDKLDSIAVHADSIFTVGDTARFLAKYRNLFRSNTKLLWIAKRAYDDTFAWIPEMSQPRTILALSGSDAFNYPCLLPGKIEISFTVEDEMGTSNTVPLRFEIVKPKAP